MVLEELVDSTKSPISSISNEYVNEGDYLDESEDDFDDDFDDDPPILICIMYK